jgi:hypothetical protein
LEPERWRTFNQDLISFFYLEAIRNENIKKTMGRILHVPGE